MQLETTFLGDRFTHPVSNAGGTCRILEDVIKFASTPLEVITVSIVYDERAGNSGQVYHREPAFSVNAYGLPSRGHKYYSKVLEQMVDHVHGLGKKLQANISAFTPEQFVELALISQLAGVDYIEFNFGCPNVKDDGVRKPIFSFYPQMMRNTLILAGQAGVETRSGVKLSPMTNPVERDETCRFFLELADHTESLKVLFLVLCNTFADVLALHPETGEPVIGVKLAGMGGPAMKPVALGHIYQFADNQKKGDLPDYIEFIGVGGVESGLDVRDFRIVGASLVQAATVCIDSNDDPGVYGEIIADFADRIGAEV